MKAQLQVRVLPSPPNNKIYVRRGEMVNAPTSVAKRNDVSQTNLSPFLIFQQFGANARWNYMAHNPLVVGSNPTVLFRQNVAQSGRATKKCFIKYLSRSNIIFFPTFLISWRSSLTAPKASVL